MHTIICIELPGQIDSALNAMRRASVADYGILALTPHVEYALEKRSVAFRRPEDYHSEGDISAVGMDDLSSLEEFSRTIDDFLESRWSILREHGIRPAGLNWYYLKLLFNSVSIRAFIMRRIIEAENPDRVFFFDTRREIIDRRLTFDQESAWSRLIPVACEALNTPCESLGGDTDPRVLGRYPRNKSWTMNGEVKNAGRMFLGPMGVRRLKTGLRRTKSVWRWLRPSRRRTGGSIIRPTVLALDSSYSLGNLLQQVQRRGDFNVIRWDVQPPQPPFYLDSQVTPKSCVKQSERAARRTLTQGHLIWSEISSLSEFPSLLRFSGIDCSRVLEDRLRRFFEVDLPELVGTYLDACDLIEATRPFAVFSSTMGDYNRQAIALAAHKANIPFVVYRHGATGGLIDMKNGVHPAIEFTDLKPADYVLAFGEGDVKYLRTGNNNHAKILPIGSTALDRLRVGTKPGTSQELRRKFGLDPERILVMYVPTDMEGNIRVAPNRNRSPSLTFLIERRLLDVFAEFPDIQFVIKLSVPSGHPCSPIAQVVKDRRLPNCITMTEPFTSVLHMADMFISDYPTTSFLEMLTTDRPIMVCGHELPLNWSADWHPSVLEMWQERVAYADDLEEFLEMLRTHLKEQRFQPVESSDTLLKLFGTHLDDGKSIDRAQEFLESLA